MSTGTLEKSGKPLKLHRRNAPSKGSSSHLEGLMCRLGLQTKTSREIELEQTGAGIVGEDSILASGNVSHQEASQPKETKNETEDLEAIASVPTEPTIDLATLDEDIIIVPNVQQPAGDDTIDGITDEVYQGNPADIVPPTSWKQDRYPKRNRFGGTRRIQVPGSEDEFLLSDCQGRRKALFIGCNYTGQNNELKGCINDCHNMAAFILSRFGFQEENMLMLTDDQDDPDYLPTAECIIGAMHWLVHDAVPGDSLFFHFSGHGVSVVDEDGDEADGFDEAICPMDYRESGVIVDDMLHDILVRPLQPGVRLTAVFDCCHSGTALDLPYVYQCDGEIQLCTQSYRKDAAKAFVEMARGLKQRNAVYAVGQLMEGLKLLRKKGDNMDAQRKTEQTKTSLADVIMFSGCRDDQTAADFHELEQATGALSTALIATLSENNEQTYTELLKNLRRKMKGQFTQIPQLSTGHPMDMNITFMM